MRRWVWAATRSSRMSEPCGPHRVRRPLRAATLRGGCPFFATEERGSGAFGQCVRAVRCLARVGFSRRISAPDSGVRSGVHIRLYCGPHFGVHWPVFWPASRSAFRCEFQCAFRPSFLPACEAALRGLLWKKASRRGVGWGGVGWGGAFAAQGLSKKSRLPEGKRSCALKCRNRRVVPRVLSRRLCYRRLLTSCCTRGRVASGLEAGRAEPVSSLTGDAPSRLTVRLLRKTGPKFPAASFATARK